MNDEEETLEARLLTLLYRTREEGDKTARTDLNALLRIDPDARRVMARLLVDEQALAGSLRENGIVALIAPGTVAREPMVPMSRFARPFGWRPLASAAAGLAIGLCSATLVYGFVLHRGHLNAGTPVAMTDGGFESNVEPAAEFVPSRTGIWSGDFATLSEEEMGVVPLEGKRMLKFLRTDNLFSPPGVQPSAGELWQVVDLAAARAALGRELSVIEVSAQFNQGPGIVGEKLAFGLGLLAFSGAASDAPMVWRERHELALAQADKKELADDLPNGWQRLSAQITVPREANLLLVQLRVVRQGKGPHSSELGPYFADDVQLRALDLPTVEAANRR